MEEQYEKKKGKEDSDVDVLDDDADAEVDAGFVPNQMQIIKTEESIIARKQKLRGTMTIKQMETAHIASHSKV